MFFSWNGVVMPREQLLQLATKVAASELPDKSETSITWGGARIVIEYPEKESEFEGWENSGIRYVFTRYAGELSWLLIQLRDIFYDADLVDGVSKIDFFCRLANAAQRYLDQQGDQDMPLMLLAVLREALSIQEEMAEGRFEFLSVAESGTVADDSVANEKRQSGFVNIEGTKQYIASLGVKVPNSSNS